MKKKIFTFLAMSLLLVFAFALTALADDRVQLPRIQLPDNYREAINRMIANHQEFTLTQAAARGDYLDARAQSVLMEEAANRVERLMMLMIEDQATMDEIASMRLDFTLPRIRSVTPPNKFISEFWIGLSEEPTEEVIEFILEFTGIPREMACFELEHPGNGSFANEPQTPEMMAASFFEEGTPEFRRLVAWMHFMLWQYETYGLSGGGCFYDWFYNEFGYRYEDVHGNDYEGIDETVEPLQGREWSMSDGVFVLQLGAVTLGALFLTQLFTRLFNSFGKRGS